MFRSALLAFAISMATSFLFADELSSPSSWITSEQQWNTLNANGVVLIDASGKDTPKEEDHYAVAAILIDAPTQTVWNVLNDHQASPTYQDSLVSSVVLEDHGSYFLLNQEVKVGFAQVEYKVKHELVGTDFIRFSRISGDMKSMNGFWRVIPVDGNGKTQTLLVYRLSLRPDFPVPSFLIRKGLNENLPDTLKSVRGQVMRMSQSGSNQSP